MATKISDSQAMHGTTKDTTVMLHSPSMRYAYRIELTTYV